MRDVARLLHRKASIRAAASSTPCWRLPTATIFGLAVEWFQAKAARAPLTLSAVICSPFTEPPRTMPKAWTPVGSAVTATT
jgi:hypothetical protein